MKPIKFKECNVTYAENQPEYLDLPAHADNGQLTTCWQLSLSERLQVLLTGKIWLQILTFHKPLQPLKIQINKPEI